MEKEKTVEGQVINASPLPQKARIKEQLTEKENPIKNISTSPVIQGKKTDGMDFVGAMKSVFDGEKITRVAWENKEIYGLRHDGFLMLHKESGEYNHWILSDEDMEADDWMSVL